MADSRRNGKIRKLVAAQDCTDLSKLSDLVGKLNSNVDVTESIDRLPKLANQEENVDLFFACDVVPALVWQLKNEGEAARSADIIGLLASKPNSQDAIAKAQPLPPLVDMLKRNAYHNSSRANMVLRHATHAIRCLAHENDTNKNIVRIEVAISVLVQLLEFVDVEVLKASTWLLHN